MCPDFEKRIVRTIPPVHHFLDPVKLPLQPKANRPFVCLVA